MAVSGPRQYQAPLLGRFVPECFQSPNPPPAGDRLRGRRLPKAPEASWTPQLLLAMGWDIGGIRTTAHVGAGYTYSPPGRGSLTGQLGFVITVPTMW